MAAECAGEQGDYWALHDWLFQNQSTWKFKAAAEELITRAAIDELGFNERAFTECLSSRRFEKEIKEDTDEALKAGARGTPAFLINGRFFPGFMQWETFQNAVEAVLAETSG
jgi:protein-disulfide isomerase